MRILSPQQLNWINGFAALGDAFHTRIEGSVLPQSKWLASSEITARHLGWSEDWRDWPGMLEAMSAGQPLKGSIPLASVYSGHQFGTWAGQLGDGRAMYLGEIETPHGSEELQLKGSGPTPYSRRGDGRAVLRSSVREFLCSEAMVGLGIPTTRALALVNSPLSVWRETQESTAIVTRIAPSFIRFGHFEHFASIGDIGNLRTLADYTLRLKALNLGAFLGVDRLEDLSPNEQYLGFLKWMAHRYSQLISQWQGVGFCHGVMNTDNMSALALTIDYGPFQFMDAFDPNHICNHTDTQGRYAFKRQPQVAYWNLFCLGQAFMSLINDSEPIVQALEHFKVQFPLETEKVYLAKLGLGEKSKASHIKIQSADKAENTTQMLDSGVSLAEEILQIMATQGVDHTILWRTLSHAVKSLSQGNPSPWGPVIDLFIDGSRLEPWLSAYEHALHMGDLAQSAQTMLNTNPKFVLRNHLGEIAIGQAKQGDPSEIERLINLLSSPFDEHPGFESYADHPPAWAKSIEISCSS